jgi:hypothetical protein
MAEGDATEGEGEAIHRRGRQAAARTFAALRLAKKAARSKPRRERCDLVLMRHALYGGVLRNRAPGEVAKMSNPITIGDLLAKLEAIQSSCQHEKFAARVSIENPRDNPDESSAYRATITIRCGLCGMSMQFVGVSPEPSADRPMVANGDTELRIPLRTPGEKPKEPIQ